MITSLEDFEDRLESRAIGEQRAVWLGEVQRVAREVSARAALDEDEAAALTGEAVVMTWVS